VESNVEIVRALSAALEQGDPLAIMARVTRDVVWTVHAADPDAAPWFGTYRGKRELLDLFAALGTLTFTDVTHKGIVADGDLVMVWLGISLTTPNGTDVQMDEVQIWTLADGRVVAVDVLCDTAAVAAGFS